METEGLETCARDKVTQPVDAHLTDTEHEKERQRRQKWRTSAPSTLLSPSELLKRGKEAVQREHAFDFTQMKMQ